MGTAKTKENLKYNAKDDLKRPLFVTLSPSAKEDLLSEKSSDSTGQNGYKTEKVLGGRADETNQSRGCCGGVRKHLEEAVSIVREILESFRVDEVVQNDAADADATNVEKAAANATVGRKAAESTGEAGADCEGKTEDDDDDGATMVVRRHRQRRRRWNWRLLLPAIGFFFAFAGDAGERMLLTLFAANLPFCWDADKLGDVTTVRLFASFLLSALALTALRKAKIDDYIIAAISIALAAVSHFAFAFTNEDWHLYAVIAVQLINVKFPPLRSAMSQECAENKVGALFAGMSFCGTMANLLGSLIIGPVYSLTVSFFPGISFFAFAAMELIAIICIMPLIKRRGIFVPESKTIMQRSPSLVTDSSFSFRD